MPISQDYDNARTLQYYGSHHTRAPCIVIPPLLFSAMLFLVVSAFFFRVVSIVHCRYVTLLKHISTRLAHQHRAFGVI